MYDPPLASVEAAEAASNLTRFFELLMQIKRENQKKGNANANNGSANSFHQA